MAMEEMNTLESLPDEMLHSVCGYLNVIDLKNLQQTSCQFAIVSREDLSTRSALRELNDPNNNEALQCPIGFKQSMLNLMKTDHINTKFLHLSSLIASNMNNPDVLIRHGILSKMVEFIKYDDKECNFKYKYEAMKMLIELHRKHKYLEEMCFGYDVLFWFHVLCQSDPVSKLLHYTKHSQREDPCLSLHALNKNECPVMEMDRDMIAAFRWDCNAKRWRRVSRRGRVCVQQNIQTGLHQFRFLVQGDTQMFQFVDNIKGVAWNSIKCIIIMHTNGA